MPRTVEFEFKGHSCTVIVPDSPAEGRPSLWRTEFLYAFNQADEALLARGFHIIFCSFSDEYGSDGAVALFKEFFEFVKKEYSLSDKSALFGFSRGALYAVNYAIKYPGDVSCLYLDAPVIDLRSWPAGLGKGCGSPAEWEDCRSRVLGISSPDEDIPINPAGEIDELMETGVPVLIVAGDSDRWVPYEENGALLEEAYKKAGRDITVIIKKGCDHHPHSLEDVTPIVEFAEAAAGII